MKKLVAFLVLCLVCTFISFAEGIDYSSLSLEELQQLIDEASSALDERNPGTEYPRVSVNELFAEYNKNEAAADLKYTNHLVEIADKVYDIDKGWNDQYEVKLGDGGLFSDSVICHMKDDQLVKIAELEKGKRAIIRGICQGDPSWSIIYFEDCEIIEE